MGGLIGDNEGTVNTSYVAVTINGAGGATFGGLIGLDSTGTYNDAYYDSTNLVCTSCGEVTGAESYTNLLSQTYLENNGWDFSSAWQAQTNDYPTLRY